MAERVDVWEIPVVWEPNAPETVLLVQDRGISTLSARARVDDEDQRSVVFVFDGTEFASMGAPNDEAISGHRLFSKGLNQVAWVGTVHDSALIADLEAQNRVHPYHRPARYASLTHWVFLFKESTVEVVARTATITRQHGSTTAAATAASPIRLGQPTVQRLRYRGTLIWLTTEQGGRNSGPPATPTGTDYAATAYVPPTTSRTGLSSFIVRAEESTAWRSAATGGWLHTPPDPPASVVPGTVVVMTEGLRDVAYFHVESVD